MCILIDVYLWFTYNQFLHCAVSSSCCSLLYDCDVTVYVGSLVMRHPGEMSTPTQGSILFGTVNGAIGKSVVHS